MAKGSRAVITWRRFRASCWYRDGTVMPLGVSCSHVSHQGPRFICARKHCPVWKKLEDAPVEEPTDD